MVTGLRDAISLNVYLNVTFESIQCIHAMSKSEKKAHNYPQVPYAKDREIVFDIWGLKLFLGHVRHVKARRRVMKDLRKRQMFVLDY